MGKSGITLSPTAKPWHCFSYCTLVACSVPEAGTGCALHPATTTLGFPPALRQSGADRAGDSGLDVVLPPKNIFEMQEVHRNANSRDVINCGKPHCSQTLLPVFHCIPDPHQCHQLISPPSALFYVFLPSGAPAHQTSYCSVFWGHFCPLCSQGPCGGHSFTPQVLPLGGVCVPAAEDRQSKQCPVISSQPCPHPDAAGSRLECFVTKLCCSQLSCSNSPLPIQAGSLCCTPDAARNCLAQNDLLTCLNGALKALAFHKMLPLASKDLN